MPDSTQIGARAPLFQEEPNLRNIQNDNWIDYDDVEKLAQQRANYCIRLNTTQGSAFAMRCGISPPTKRKDKSNYLRLINPKWWKRKIFTKIKRDRELLAIHSGRVQRLTSPYCSQFAFEAIRKQDELNQKLMKEIKLISGKEEITLFDAWKSSTGNPYNRYSELVTRVKGYEVYANKKGHTARFITITAPSKFHAYHSSGFKNQRYKNYTPRETNQYLMRVWRRVRAQLAKRNIEIYGLRIVEPHHDATPHYHMVIFGIDHHLNHAINIMQNYFTREDRPELVDDSIRFDCTLINSALGSAVGYVIKYLAKNIVCESVNQKAGVDTDTLRPVTETAGKVVAWARTWGIRQFSFFGGASVTPWRELRRVKTMFDDPLLEELRQSAHSSNWGEYQDLMDDLNVKPYAVDTFDKTTGEILLNQYQEPIRKIKGIQDDSSIYITHLKEWKFQSPMPVLNDALD